MMKNWGIHKRVLFITITPAIIISILLLAYHIYIHAALLEQQLTSSGNLLAKRIASASEYAILTGNTLEILDIVRPALAEENVVAIAIQAANGKVLLDEINESFVPAKFRKVFQVPISQRTIELSDTLNEGTRPDEQETATLGYVTITLSTEATLKKQRTIIINTTGITFAGLLFGVLLALWIGRSVSNPILQLSSAVYAIGKQKLGTRVSLGVGGELGKLGDGINKMASELEELHGKMQAKIDVATSVLTRTIDELETKNEELDEARLQALEANRIKSEFMGNISHEILTPMNSIIGYNDLLTKTRDPAEIMNYHRTIRESSQSLLSIVNNLLDFSSIDTGQLSLASVDFNLREIIEDAVISLSGTAFSKNLELILLFYDDVPVLLNGDPSRVKQLITTFVENAIKFTEKGEITIRVMQEDNTPEHAIIGVSISDTGIGIDHPAMDRVMDAFAQADLSTTKKYSGIGLGLVIARNLITKMDGDVSFDSTLGKGTTFRFNMRLGKQINTEATDNIIPEQIGRLYKSILVCDQNPASRLSIKHALSEICSDLQEASGFSALASLVNRQARAKDAFRIIIIIISADDVTSESMLPVFSKIHNREQYIFIAMIGSNDSNLYTLAHRQGFDICIPRTFRKKDLQYLVAHADSEAVAMREDPATSARDIRYLANLRVLVADDNAINRTLLKTLLESHGISCSEAENGEIATEKALSHSFDLIFMDIHMPGMSGIEAAKQIRERERTSTRIPIIAVTANRTAEIYNQILAAGMEDCLVKPIMDDSLMDIIHKWVAIRKIVPAEKVCRGPGNSPASNSTKQHDAPPYADLNLPHYAGFDHALAMRITAGNKKLAADLCRMFLEDIPGLQAEMNHAAARHEMEKITSAVHQIHGAAAYCAVPQIKTTAHTLEKALLQNPHDLQEELIAQLNRHIDTLLQQNGR